MKIGNINFKALTAFVLVGTLILLSLNTQLVFAAALGSLSDVMTRLKTTTLSSHDITFTLGGSTTFDAGETMAIDFNEDTGGFAVNAATSVIADFDFNDGTERTIIDVDVGAPVCVNGVNNIAVGIVEATGVVTFEACGTYNSSGSGAVVNIEYGTAATGPGTNRVTNPGSAQNYLIDITAAGDDGKIAVDIQTEDQISVTASVDPSLDFLVTTTALNLGTLTTGSVSPAGPNSTSISTNAHNGYALYVSDLGDGAGNPGLYNTAASYLIASADIDLGSNAGYGFQCSKTGGGGACQAPYNSGSDVVGGLLTSAMVFASYGSKPSGTDTYGMYVKAKAAGADEAGSYSDTLTVIGTAIF